MIELCFSLIYSEAEYCVVFPLNLPLATCIYSFFLLTFCFKASKFAFQLNILVHWVEPHNVSLRSSFLTNFALSLYCPWHKLRRYKPASADNASDRNAPSIPNKQDAQPWGEQDPQLVCVEQTADQGGGTVRTAFSFSAKTMPLLA